MRKDYEMITLKAYVDSLDNVKCLTVSEKEICETVEKYILSQRRNETNAKIVEALLA